MTLADALVHAGLVAAHDFSVAVVQCAATVAHDRAASRCLKDAAEGLRGLQWQSEAGIMPQLSHPSRG